MALGDIASSLVCLHDLLRDLGTIAAYPAGAAYRDIRVVAIETWTPLKITLSLHAIPADAVKAFQEICRAIILSRERRARDVDVSKALGLLSSAGGHISETEERRLRDHIGTLLNADVPLKRVVVRKD